jgi:hypothetical protein
MQLAQLAGTTDSDAGCDLALTNSYCVLCNASLTPVHTITLLQQNISCVVGAKDSARALRTVHAAFLLSHQTVSVGVVGCGSIGGAFLDIVQTQV